MNDNSKEAKLKLLAEIDRLFDATDDALSEWQVKAEEGNLQFPTLLLNMAVKFNWDDKTMRENDPIVRKIVRNHPDWYVTRGAHGGIMRASERQKKEAAIAAKALAKKQMQDAIEAKVAALTTAKAAEPASE